MSAYSEKLNYLIVTVLFLCMGCDIHSSRSDTEAANTITEHDIPIFNSGDTLQFANEVRRFVAQRTTLGNVKHPACVNFDTIPLDHFPVSTFLNIFDSLQGTASCGLSAYLMTRILLDNGINAYTYDFGFEHTPFTHMVTLVKHRNDYLIFDPYFNYALQTNDGVNIGILEILNRIAEKDLVVHFNSDTVTTWFILDTTRVDSDRLEKLKSAEYQQFNFETEETRNGFLTAQLSRCFPCALNPMGLEFKSAFEEKLRQETQFTEFHEAFALKINRVSGAADADSVDRLIETKLVDLGLKPAISTYTVQ